ncbi:Uncharacterized protein TCM_001384 [Theobroma cacao]|uniref:Uncharacterized protein n=1 Tax=Theobroma cacao TaxID=3641 RepID=A0A061DJB4_THECC|nr:Uncharacterized protein TCM_001384 [Theobroma cacao]
MLRGGSRLIQVVSDDITEVPKSLLIILLMLEFYIINDARKILRSAHGYAGCFGLNVCFGFERNVVDIARHPCKSSRRESSLFAAALNALRRGLIWSKYSSGFWDRLCAC